MLLAELKALGTTDVVVPNYDLRAWRPEQPMRFRVYVEAFIGPRGQPGEDRFSFDVCSPLWFADHTSPRGFEFMRMIVMDRWSYPILERAISDLCLRTTGPDWDTIARRLAMLSDWEFEGYTEFQAP